MQSLGDYITSNVSIGPGGCWLWMKSKNKKGYGLASWSGIKLAHRAAYQAFRGPIPEGLCVCHKCDVPACCNPDHLFLGTQLDNMRDAKAKGRMNGQSQTHCRRGHPLSGDNVRLLCGDQRECRECNRDASRERMRSMRARRREASHGH